MRFSIGRVEVSRRTAGLLIGDLLAIGLFVGAGELRHGGSLLDGASTFFQFGAGWLLAGAVLGAFAGDAIETRQRAVTITAAAWVLATGVGQLLRALMEPGFYIAPSFVAVTLAVGGILLLGWRVMATAWLRGRSGAPARDTA